MIMKFSFNSDENISHKFLENNINYSNKILSKIGFPKIIKKNINIIDNKLINLISLDSYAEIYLPKIKISNIEKKCEDLYPFVYSITSENKNIIKLKWIRTNNLESYESIKNYFIKIKKNF